MTATTTYALLVLCQNRAYRRLILLQLSLLANAVLIFALVVSKH